MIQKADDLQHQAEFDEESSRFGTDNTDELYLSTTIFVDALTSFECNKERLTSNVIIQCQSSKGLCQ